MYKSKYYITTAIVYASGKPHIGNVYDPVLADCIARYKRCSGYDVFFLTGTDEHGQKIELKANENNLSPKMYVDNISSIVKSLYDKLNIQYDRFIRTTDEDHIKACQHIFEKLYNQGDIYKSNYEGWYCTHCESFFTDSQLVNGKCLDCGRDVCRAKEEAYFFKMSKYVDKLIEYYKTDCILPESRKNEMINNFIKPGLKDLCVSRSTFNWGIKVPFDDKHIIYVWLDALNNYITGLGYDTVTESKIFNKFWPADLHVIGKDIVRFHTIYWPIFLMALGLKLPKKIFGHPWLLSNDDKMSKSKGNVLYPDELIDEFGVDAVRFYLLHEMPYENDGVISIQLFCEKYNVDLANVLGNLVSRTISMINKYNDGILVYDKNIEYNNIDKNLIYTINYCKSKYESLMNNFKIFDSLNTIFDIFTRCNKYIDETEPWALCKNENYKNRLNNVLYNLSCGICIGAKILYPFMPKTSEKILSDFNAADIELRNFEVLNNNVKVTSIKQNLFNRIDVDLILEKFNNR